MLLFYVRHGDPIYHPDSLTPLGQRQAEALAKRLSVYGLDEIYSSPSIRAQQTAQPTCELLKKEKILLDWCNESLAWNEMCVHKDDRKTWCFSDAHTKELLSSPEVRALGDKWYTHSAFDGTKFADGVARVEGKTDEFMASLGYRNDRERGGYIAEAPNSKRIALFAHQGFGMSFLSALLNIPYNIFSTRFDLSHSGMTVIKFSEKEGFSIPIVLQLSNDSHLYREGIATRYNNVTPI